MDTIEFVASGRSTGAWSRRSVWLGTAIALALFFINSGVTSATMGMAGVVLGLVLVLDLTLMRKLRAGSRVALLDAQGMESPLFRPKPGRYAWHEIASASLQFSDREGRTIELELRPLAGRTDAPSMWAGGNPARPRLPVQGLVPRQQEALLALVLQRCGRPGTIASATAAVRQERVFQERLEGLAPTPWLTYLLVAANVLVWLLMTAKGVDGRRADATVLFAWGANSAHAVLQDGEWWRLLTATFLHGGFLHLAMNMLGLYSAGVTVERLYGRLHYALIYFGAALAGSALSLHFAAQRVVSVGASGAVFGVAVALLVGLHGHRKDLPPGAVRRMGGGIGFFIVYSLVQGFTHEGVDNAAHVGGLLAGAALAWWLPTRVDAERQATTSRRAGTGAALLVAAVLALAATAEPGVDQRAYFASMRNLQQGLRTLDGAYRALEQDQQEAKAGRLTELKLDERSRSVHAPAFRRAVEQLQQVELPADDKRREFAADALRAAQLVAELLAMDSDIVDGRPVPARPERYAAAEKELSRVSARLKEQADRIRTPAR